MVEEGIGKRSTVFCIFYKCVGMEFLLLIPLPQRYVFVCLQEKAPEMLSVCLIPCCLSACVYPERHTKQGKCLNGSHRLYYYEMTRDTAYLSFGVHPVNNPPPSPPSLKGQIDVHATLHLERCGVSKCCCCTFTHLPPDVLRLKEDTFRF